MGSHAQTLKADARKVSTLTSAFAIPEADRE